MVPHTTAATANILPYTRAYRDLSASTAELLYQHCHATYADRVAKAFGELQPDDGELRPTAEVIAGLVGLIDKVSRTESLPEPEASFFSGEAMITWRCNRREVSLLSRGAANDPKLLKYERRPNGPSWHEVHNSINEYDLKKAIGFTDKRHGWLYE